MQAKNLAKMLDFFTEESQTSAWHFLGAKIIVLHQDLLKRKTLYEVTQFIKNWIAEAKQLLVLFGDTYKYKMWYELDDTDVAAVFNWYNDFTPTERDVQVIEDLIKKINTKS